MVSAKVIDGFLKNAACCQLPFYAEIESFLSEKPLSLIATLNKMEAYQDASFIIVATPTNYDPDTNCFV